MASVFKHTGGRQQKGLFNTFSDHLGKFMIIGCITTCIDIMLIWAFTDLLGIWYLVSAGLSYGTSAMVSFGLNKFLNFKNESHEYVKQGSSFLIIASGSLMLNLIIISLCVELWSINYLIAKVIATGVAFILNYYGQSVVTFRVWR
ncbi:MAG TPA: GtrA family protein [Methanospirillum sp.]|nr:GtrA family protein [Methanospirillum sp.]